ncbi:MAG: serine/threonine-protein kinase [Pseudomonadota bacterium]|nr:serine/threonine-protein kinase [Pseudomonadota bacterium]
MPADGGLHGERTLPMPATATTVLATIACPQCRTENRAAATFCRQCVAPLPQRSPEAFAATVQDVARNTPAALPLDRLALPVGHHIAGFDIEEVLGQGGFGIVYRAWDVALERHVAIKEYLPAALVTRATGSLHLTVRPGEATQAFGVGLSSFVNEARLLARFDHRALVKVFRFWEANGTAYMAMPFYRGPTLKTALDYLRRPPSERLVRKWLAPLLDALEILHAADCYHRDISPDNILLTSDGPVLLDFGAARRVIADRTQVLTTLLKPSFAPIEQYGSTGAQGPWTDLYALAGVVHYALTGRAAPPATVRVLNDPWLPLSSQPALRAAYSAELLGTVDAALAVLPEGRPASVAAFRQRLGLPGTAAKKGAAPHGAAAVAPAPAPASAPAPLATPVTPETPAAGAARAPRATEEATPAASPRPSTPPADPVAPASQFSPLDAAAPVASRARPAPSRWRWPAVAGGVAAVAAALLWTLVDRPAPVVPRAASTAAPAVAAPTPAPAPTPVAAPAAAAAAVVPAAEAQPAPALVPASLAPSTTAPAPMTAAATADAPATRGDEAPRRTTAAATARRGDERSRTSTDRSSARERPRATPTALAQADAAVAETTSAARPAPRGARCSDLMLQSSLQPLGKQDLAYLREQCK